MMLGLSAEWAAVHAMAIERNAIFRFIQIELRLASKLVAGLNCLPTVARMHLCQRGRTSITGLALGLRLLIKTGRLAEVVMTRLVRLDGFYLESGGPAPGNHSVC